MTYNWQLKGWPEFIFDVTEVQSLIVELAQEIGEVNGLIIGLPEMLSLSKIIEGNKAAYYNALKAAQRSIEITSWINYFAAVILEAQRHAKTTVQFTLIKAQFFDRYKNQLNDRQLKAINKMLEKSPEEFEGGMTARKYISINKTSKATATRDLQQLYTMGVLVQTGAGRSVSYQLNIG